MPLYCHCHAVLWWEGPKGHEGPKWLRGFTFYCFSVRFKKPLCFVVFPPHRYLSPVRTHRRARRNAVFSLANNENKKKKINKSQSAKPDQVTSPGLTMLLLTSTLQPNPCPPAKTRMLEDSDLFTQESHLGFSGRLGGGRGTGSARWSSLYIPVGGDSSFSGAGPETGFGKLGS